MIVVTGGSGFIGSHIVRKLNESGESVRAIVRSLEHTEKESRLKGLGLECVQADITNIDSLKAVFSGAKAVIHTVAIAIEKVNLSYQQVNTQGTINVVEAMKSVGVRRLVHLSQLGANSQLPYRLLSSKGKAHEFVKSSHLDWTIFHPSVVWGPEDEFVNIFAKLAQITPIIFPIVDRNAKFQPIWVDDLATAVYRSIDDPTCIEKEYELGGPDALSLLDIEKIALDAVGTKRIFLPFPRSILNMVVMLLEKFLPSPPVTRGLLELLSVDNVTTDNSILKFVAEPRALTVDNISTYVKDFKVSDTLLNFFHR